MKICCVPTNKLPVNICSQTNAFKEDYRAYLSELDICWIERAIAEHDEKYKQVIPYVLVQNYEGDFACYTRHGTEKRLHGLLSCGLGGHIDEPDRDITLENTIRNGMLRELTEELQDFNEDKISLDYLGIINEVESEVGHVHLGIVFIAKCNKDYLPKAAEETKDLEWKTLDEINSSNKELWTELAIKLLYCLTATWTKTRKLIRCIIKERGTPKWQKDDGLRQRKKREWFLKLCRTGKRFPRWRKKTMSTRIS